MHIAAGKVPTALSFVLSFCCLCRFLFRYLSGRQLNKIQQPTHTCCLHRTASFIQLVGYDQIISVFVIHRAQSEGGSKMLLLEIAHFQARLHLLIELICMLPSSAVRQWKLTLLQPQINNHKFFDFIQLTKYSSCLNEAIIIRISSFLY